MARLSALSPPLVCLTLAALLPTQEPLEVPDLRGVPNAATFVTNVQENFGVAAQTSYGLHGVAVSTVADLENWEDWTDPQVRFVDPTSSGLDPTVQIIEDSVFLCWVERSVVGTSTNDILYFDASLNAGVTWGTPKKMGGSLISGGPTVNSYKLSIVESQDTVFSVITASVSYPNPENGRVAGTRSQRTDGLLMWVSDPGGATFSTPVLVPERNPWIGDVDQFAVAVDGERLVTAYTDDRAITTAGNQLFVRVLDFGQGRFEPEILVTPTGRKFAGELLLQSSQGRTGLAWREPDPSGTRALFATVSGAGGASFETPQRLGGAVPARDDVSSVAMAVSGTTGALTVAWADDRFGPSMVFSVDRPVGSQQWNGECLVFPMPATVPALTPAEEGPVMVSARSFGAWIGALSRTDGTWSLPFQLTSNASAADVLVSSEHGNAGDVYSLAWLVGDTTPRQVVGRYGTDQLPD